MERLKKGLICLLAMLFMLGILPASPVFAAVSPDRSIVEIIMGDSIWKENRLDMGVNRSQTLTVEGFTKDSIAEQNVTAGVTFTSSDPKVAEVSKTGVIKSLKVGSAKITAVYGKLVTSFTVYVHHSITQAPPKVVDSDGKAVNAVNLGFTSKTSAEFIEIDGVIAEPDSSTTYGGVVVDWNRAGYEFLGWSLAGGEPFLGELDIGTGYSKYDSQPVRRYVAAGKRLALDGTAANWRFSAWVAVNNALNVSGTNTVLTDSFTFCPVFRLKAGYDPLIPLTDTDTNVESAPVRRGVAPLTEESFQGGKLVGTTEVIYGKDIYDRYEVKVPAEQTRFSFDVPVPPQGAAVMQVFSTGSDDESQLPVTTEIIGNVMRVTVDYSAAGSLREVQGASYTWAGHVQIRMNYPEKTSWGGLSDKYCTTYEIQYFRESATGVLDGQYRFNLIETNRTLQELGISFQRLKSNYYNSDVIMLNESYTYGIYNYYTQAVKTAKLEKIVVNGVDISIPDQTETEKKYNVPNTGGGTVAVGVQNGSDLYLRFDQLFPSRDVDVELVFEPLVPKYRLTVTGSNNSMGKVTEVKFDRKDADGNDIYLVRVELKQGCAVGDCVADGSSLHAEPLKTEWDYKRELTAGGWTSKPTQFYVTYEFTVSRNTDMVMRFKPWDYSLSLKGYSPAVPSLSITARGNRAGGAGQTELLYPNLKGASVSLNVDTEGWFYTPDQYDSDVAGNNTLEVYAGGSEAVGNPAKLAVAYDNFVINGDENDYELTFTIPNIGDNTTFTAVLNRNGIKKTLTFQAKTVLEIPQIRQLFDYYLANFGMDKFGLSAYSEADKKSEEYKKYVQYANTRLYLRSTLENACTDIARAGPELRAAKLEQAKNDLQLAAKGVDGYAVAANCSGLAVAVVAPNEENLGYRGGVSTAMTAMIACMEATHPGNWSFSIADIVTGFSAGEKNDTGKVIYQSERRGNAGFWYLNGVFARWGVGNYRVQDGDVCTWGGGSISQISESKAHYSQSQVWNLALLYQAYSDEELEGLSRERGLFSPLGWKTALTGCAAEELRRLFPEQDFTRFGRHRALNEADKVKELIFAIGSVGPESGPAIQRAREAYDALDDADKRALGDCSQYDILTNAERYYAQVTAGCAGDNSEQAGQVLESYTGTVSNPDTVAGMLGLVAAAQSDLTADNAQQTRELISKLNLKLTRDQTDLKNKVLTFGRSYYGYLVLGLSAMGYNAANYLDSEGNAYDFTAYLKDFDAVTADGVSAAAWALIALDGKPYDVPNTEIRQRYAAWLVSRQHRDGAWGDDLPDPDTTALALAALALYRDDADVDAAVERGLSALRTFESEYGGFYNRYGVYDTMTTTLAVIALSALGIDADSWATASGGNPVGSLLNSWRPDSMFQMEYAETDKAGMEPMAALIAYARAKDAMSGVFDLRGQFGQTFRLPVAAQAIDDTAMAEVGEELVSAAVKNAEAESAKTLQLQLVVAAEPESGEEAERWDIPTPADTEAVEGKTVEETEILSFKRYVLKMTAEAAALLKKARLALTVETEIGTVALDEGLVSEMATAAGRDFVLTLDATKEEYTVISPAVDGGDWQTSRESEISIPVAEPDPGLLIARVDGSRESPFWKTTVVRRAMTVAMKLPCTLRIYKPSFVYGDMAEDSRFAGAAKFAAARNLFDDKDGMFGADETVSMATLLRALYQLEETPEINTYTLEEEQLHTENGFSWYVDAANADPDHLATYQMEEDAWYADILVWAYTNGLVKYENGYNQAAILGGNRDGYYHIQAETALSRDQVAGLLYNYASYLDLDVSNKADLSPFKDYTTRQTAQWNLLEDSRLAWAVYEGLLTADEDGNLNPNAKMSKGDLAKMLQSVVINVSGGVRGDDGNSLTGPVTGEAPGEQASDAGTTPVTISALTPTPEETKQEEEQDNMTVTEEPQPAPEPDDPLEVNADVTQVTKNGSWFALLPIAAACLAAVAALLYLLVVKKQKRSTR